MTGLNFIINADDFGMNAIVNQSIYRLLEKKAISSATIMANGHAVDEATKMSKDFGWASFGLHLNLTNFETITEDIKSTQFCDSEGSFNGKFREKSTIKHSQLILNEWMSQLALVQDKGITISHFDSHHHIHTHPTAFIALIQLLKRSGINKVRNTRNLVSSKERNSSSQKKYAAKRIWSNGMKLLGRANSPRYFCSVNDFYELLQNEPQLIPENGCIELMCHPGDLGNNEYIFECELLEQRAILNHSDSYSLISYNEL